MREVHTACVFACVSVRAITFQCLDIETSILVWENILTISRSLGEGQCHLGNRLFGLLDTKLFCCDLCYFKWFLPGFTGADPGFDRGGPDCDRPKLPTVCSSFVREKRALFSVGSRAYHRAPEALGYFITKYAFSPFWGTFLYYF